MLGLNGGNSSGSDPNHESTEPALGSTSNPWRTPETRYQHLPGHSRQDCGIRS